jgi:acetate kinase
MSGSLLVLNAGSSTLKYAAYRAEGGRLSEIVRGTLEGTDSARAFEVLDERLAAAAPGERPFAVGHRVVHGGPRFEAPVAVDDSVSRELDALLPLDPLHQAPSLAALHAARAHYPGALHVACFDTAFHRRHSDVADAIALPRPLRDAGLRRYGFHGLSYEYIAGRLREIDPAVARGRVVVAHLGNGASLCALDDGRSVDSTMTFTALDGLVMGTRPGSLDAGALLWLLGQGWDRDRLSRLLWNESGLLALSGVSSDMRNLIESDVPSSRFAVDVFVWTAGKQVAAMAASLGGLDALVFTAGIGENQPETRARIAARLRFLGVELDEDANHHGELRISPAGARVATFVIPTDEEIVIARHTLRLSEATPGKRGSR